jgi:hypothetical protein
VSEDFLLTWDDLATRWRIEGPTPGARMKTVRRRARDLGVKPFTPPRTRPALIRPADVLRAEERGARK